MDVSHHRRTEGTEELPVVVWRPGSPRTVLSSGVLGGGLGERRWILNATVHRGYDGHDPAAHLAAIARQLDLGDRGVGLMTAVDVGDLVRAVDGDVVAWATVGVEEPQWAAAPSPTWHDAVPGEPPGRTAAPRAGTINLVVDVPVRLDHGALVNAAATATEAKVQALLERPLAGTGTPTDALCICCPTDGPVEPYAGPRSVWGARIARAVHAAVVEGLARGGDRT